MLLAKKRKKMPKKKKDARHSVLDSGVELGRICGHEEVTNI
jgi:hypothetical protein